MFNKIIPFIGRNYELNKVQELLFHENSSIVFLTADGGIGKTRLLKEIENIYQKDENVLVVDIIDYDSYQILTIEDIQLAFIKIFDKDIFQKFIELKDKYKNKYLSEELQDLILDNFITIFNTAIKNKKMLFFLDTVEKIDDEIFWKKFASLSTKLKNITFILSGREKNFRGEKVLLEEKYWDYIHHNINIEYLRLQKFSLKESEDYLIEKCKIYDVYNLPEDLEKYLINLVDGKPILLDLLIEWATYKEDFEISVKKLLGIKNLEQDDSHIDYKEKQKEFEGNLVKHLGNEDIVRIMSLQSPLDFELYNEILDELYDESISKDKFQEIQQRSYIKDLENGTIVFHDEMYRLVKEYLVPHLDEEEHKSMERDISQITTEYYDKKLKNLHIQESDSLERSFEDKDTRKYEYEQYTVSLIEALFKVANQSDRAYSRLKTEFAKAKSEYNYKLMRELINVSSLDSLVDLNQKADYITMEAKVLSIEGQNQKARDLILNYIRENNLGEFITANLYNMLAGIEASIGFLQNAYKYQSIAYKYFEETKRYMAIIFSSAHIGKLHEEFGDFKKAIEYSENALLLDSQINCLKVDQRAILLNRLSNLYRLESEYNTSFEQVEDTLSIEGLNEKTIALLQITKGNLLRDEGKYHEAMECYEEASEVITELNDIEKVLQLYLGRGVLYLLRFYDKQDTLDLDSALDDFTKVENISTKYSSYYSELVEVQSYLARVYWEKKMKNEAREKLVNAKEISVKNQQVYCIIDLILASAEFDYDERNYDKMEEYKAEIATYKSEFMFPLLYGRMLKIEADIKFNQKSYDESMKLYVETLCLIDQHHGYSIYTTKEFLKKISDRLFSIELSSVQIENLLVTFETKMIVMKQKAKLDSHTEKKLIKWLNRLRFKIKIMR